MANEKRLDLIDRKALLKTLDRYINTMPDKEGYHFLCGLSTAITEIEDAPTVDAVEVVHGRWIADRWTKWQCDKCHSPSPAYGYPRMEYVKTRYCPNCGAKMYGGNEDGVDD